MKNLIHRLAMAFLACALFALFADHAYAQAGLAGIDVVSRQPQPNGTVIITLRIQKDAEQYVDSKTLARAYGTDITSIREANLTTTLAACGASRPRVPQEATAEQALILRASNGLWEGCADQPQKQRLVLIQGETIKVTRGASAMPVKERLRTFQEMLACTDAPCVVAHAKRAGAKIATSGGDAVAQTPTAPSPTPSADPPKEMNLMAKQIKNLEAQKETLMTAYAFLQKKTAYPDEELHQAATEISKLRAEQARLKTVNARLQGSSASVNRWFYGMALFAMCALALLVWATHTLHKKEVENKMIWKQLQTSRGDLAERESDLDKQRILVERHATELQEERTHRQSAELGLKTQHDTHQQSLERNAQSVANLRSQLDAYQRRDDELQALERRHMDFILREDSIKEGLLDQYAFVAGHSYPISPEQVVVPRLARDLEQALHERARECFEAISVLDNVATGAQPPTEEAPFSVTRLDTIKDRLTKLGMRLQDFHPQSAGFADQIDEILNEKSFAHVFQQQDITQEQVALLQAELSTSKDFCKLLRHDVEAAEAATTVVEARAKEAEERAAYLETALVESISEIAEYAKASDEDSGVRIRPPEESRPETIRGVGIPPGSEQEAVIFTAKGLLEILQSEPKTGRIWEKSDVHVLAELAQWLGLARIYQKDPQAGQPVQVDLFQVPTSIAV